MSFSYNFKYALLQKVEIDGSIGGIITAILITPGWMDYKVEWWTNGECRSAYFDESRLKPK